MLNINPNDYPYLTSEDFTEAERQLNNGEPIRVVLRRLRDWNTGAQVEIEVEALEYAATQGADYE